MIQRYDPQIATNFDDPYAYLDQEDYGDCVLYEDYLAVVYKLEERVRELEDGLDNAQRRIRMLGERQYGLPG